MQNGNKIKSTHDFERSSELLKEDKHASKKILACILAIVGTMYIIRQFITYEEFTPFYVALFLAVPGSAVGMSLIVLKSQMHTQFARTFVFLTLALVFLFTAEQIWTVFEYFLFIDPFPSIADIFYVLSYPFFALFLFSYLKPLQKYITKQIIGFAIILSFVFILPVMMTTYEFNSESGILEFVMALAYPIGDAILLVPAIIGILFFFRGKRNYFWGSMLIGISLTIIGDIVFTFLDAAEAYEGGNLIDLCWLFGYVFWTFACYDYRKNSSDSTYEIENSKLFNPIDYTTIQKIVIPLTITIIILVVGISLFNIWNDVHLEGDSSHAFQHMTYIVFGIIGIFLVIMIVIYKNLERLISLRTKELQEKQVIIEEQYTKLQQVEKEKGEFLAMITHELKTPLVPIKGYAELLLSEKLGKLDEGQKKRIEIINKSSDTLLKLINDLLDNQKIELGKLKLIKDKLDLGTTIIETLEKFKQTLSAKSITLSTNIKNNVFVNGDKIRIEQVLQNIILNAVDFLPEKDGKLDVVLSSDKNYASVSIADNGIGISQEKITRLFDRFYQIDASYTREHGGSGLGLSICKAIIDKHDGIIGAHSEGKGKGSTFFFKIPLLK